MFAQFKRPKQHTIIYSLFLFCALISSPAHAGQTVLEDFDTGVANWKMQEQVGRVTAAAFNSDQGTSATAGMRIDYDFQTSTADNGATTCVPGIGLLGYGNENDILVSRPFAIDLSMYQALTLDFRSIGSPYVMIMLFIWDSQGHYSAWGPYGSNWDMQTGSDMWHTVTMHMAELISPPDKGANLADIRKIGLLVNGYNGTGGSIWIDNITALHNFGSVSVDPSTFSPNGDGYYDTTLFTFFPYANSLATLEILAGGTANLLATPFRNQSMGDIGMIHEGSCIYRWDGKDNAGHTVADGAYTARFTFRTAQETHGSTTTVTIDTRNPKTAIAYQAEPFFPIGVWFEGDPNNAHYTDSASGAKAYFDRCFADLSAHNFNAVSVANCPHAYNSILMQSAIDKGVKIILGGYFDDLVNGNSLTQAQADNAARQFYDSVGSYSSLLRYEIRDEPSVGAIPDWLTVQRAMWQLDKKHPVFSCFYYGSGLKELTDQSLISEAVFDIYPLAANTSLQNLYSFVPWLLQCRSAAQDYPIWPVLQAFAQPNTYRYPTVQELRAMTWLSLAAGAKGVFYFIYQTLPYHPQGLQGLVDADGSSTPLYDEATTLAGAMKKLTPLLLSLQFSGAFPIRELSDVVVGQYVTDSGQPVVIVASKHPETAVTASIKLIGPGIWQDVLSKEQFVRGSNGMMSLPLDAGAGRVLMGAVSCADASWMELR